MQRKRKRRIRRRGRNRKRSWGRKERDGSDESQ